MKTIVLFGLVLLLTSMQLCFAGQEEVMTDANGVAINGYDPVAYFTQGRPMRGSAEFSAVHNEVKYYFASSADKNRFLDEPDKYTPQYGGYCAYGAAHGDKLTGDPEAWKIVDGKLFLTAGQGSLKRFEENTPDYIEKADAIWERIKNRTAGSLGG